MRLPPPVLVGVVKPHFFISQDLDELYVESMLRENTTISSELTPVLLPV